MTDTITEPYSSGDYLTRRLDAIFGQYRPVLPTTDVEQGESTDDVLRRVLGADEWAKVEAHREREAEAAITRHNAEMLKQAWQEAEAAGVQTSWAEFERRLRETPAERAHREQMLEAFEAPSGQSRDELLGEVAAERRARLARLTAAERAAEAATAQRTIDEIAARAR